MDDVTKREPKPPKLGRPRRAKTAAQHVVCARLTNAEREAWERAAGELALSEWIRETCNAAARRTARRGESL